MGRSALYIVSFSFIAFVAFALFGSSYFLGSLSVEPVTILGGEPSEEFEVEQSLNSEEGNILVAIDRENQFRLHIIQPATPSKEGLTTEEILTVAKAHRVGSTKERPQSFLIRYLSATLDMRRATSKEIVELEGKKLFDITGPKKRSSYVWYDSERDTLFYATHPNEVITAERFVKSLNDNCRDLKKRAA